MIFSVSSGLQKNKDIVILIKHNPDSLLSAKFPPTAQLNNWLVTLCVCKKTFLQWSLILEKDDKGIELVTRPVAVVKADRAAGCADMILQHLIRVIRNLPSFIPDGAKAEAPPLSPPRSGVSIRIISSRFPIRTDTLGKKTVLNMPMHHNSPIYIELNQQKEQGYQDDSRDTPQPISEFQVSFPLLWIKTYWGTS